MLKITIQRNVERNVKRLENNSIEHLFISIETEKVPNLRHHAGPAFLGPALPELHQGLGGVRAQLDPEGVGAVGRGPGPARVAPLALEQDQALERPSLLVVLQVEAEADLQDVPALE